MIKSRDTRTGSVLEALILPVLDASDYPYRTQVDIATRPGGGRHRIDAVIQTTSGDVLLSVKWQQVSGTAEQKVPFEVMCLADTIRSGSFRKAYLVLGGNGWKLRDFFTGGGLDEHLVHSKLVSIVTLETFIALANRQAI
jgi:hypothetical protein